MTARPKRRSIVKSNKMRGLISFIAVASTFMAGCAWNPDRQTLAELRGVEPDLTEVRVENGLDQAISGYRKFLDEAPPSSLTPEAMRRLADLKLERKYGILGESVQAVLPTPESSAAQRSSQPVAESQSSARARSESEASESDRAFEKRAAALPGPVLPSVTVGAWKAELESLPALPFETGASTMASRQATLGIRRRGAGECVITRA